MRAASSLALSSSAAPTSRYFDRRTTCRPSDAQLRRELLALALGGALHANLEARIALRAGLLALAGDAGGVLGLTF